MGAQKNVAKNEEEIKKIVVVWCMSQANNKLPCILFKRTSYTATKHVKACKTI